MKKIAILVPEHSVIQAIADPQYCFSAVNNYRMQNGLEPLFELTLVGLKPRIKLNQGNYLVQPDQLMSPFVTYDLIIIPALFGDLQVALDANKKFIPWLIKQYAKGAELASLCLGAFLLASTGLVNGMKCSTHWSFANKFRNKFPDVIMQEGQIVTDEHGIYTSGGAHSYWNLLLHLVEKFTDRETAIYISKYFAIEINRNRQSVFALFTGQKDHHDEVVKQAQHYIEQNTEKRITVEMLAEKLAVGRRSFERRFKKATNNSVLEYIQRVKIETAKRQFESSVKTISEVMFEVGYNDSKAFRNTFKKVTGLTPAAYRNRYHKILV
ncbi:MAG: AraC family transcriptional regulator [Bacteroidetes bacterium HGW-Bacteroidetes-4]|jgi:transcriptional regulator GlxA family with amidase domain|nr:MAG: AraC family transcriptional regulator [Bacteroidetes bacterium HGW-Bacteroidetes-4]